MEDRMINLLKAVIVISCLLFSVFGCAHKDLVKVDLRNDIKQERIVKEEPTADILVNPERSMTQGKNNINIEIVYLRKMTDFDYKCIDSSYNELDPKLLFAFRMLNTGDEIKYYTPVFAFKGVKSLDLADKDPCSFFNNYGAINYVLAKPGNRLSLSCGEGEGSSKSASLGSFDRTVTLYPDIPAYGILIVNGKELDNAQVDNEGVKHTIVKGWAAFYEKTSVDQKPISFKFNYEFTRKDWLQDVAYNKRTPYTYQVKVFQNSRNLPVLGKINGDIVEEKIPGSESYSNPSFERIGVVSK